MAGSIYYDTDSVYMFFEVPMRQVRIINNIEKIRHEALRLWKN